MHWFDCEWNGENDCECVGVGDDGNRLDRRGCCQWRERRVMLVVVGLWMRNWVCWRYVDCIYDVCCNIACVRREDGEQSCR